MSVIVENSPIADIFEGNLVETRMFLEKRGGHRFLTIDMDSSKLGLEPLAPALEILLPLLARVQQDRYSHKMQALIEALVPDIKLPERAVREAQMLASARQFVVEGAEWLTAPQIAELAGFSMSNPSAGPGRWKKQGFIFTIAVGGTEFFPVYGLDAETQFRPRPILKSIIAKLSPTKDGWGMAYWFGAANSYLGGRRPLDCLEHVNLQMSELPKIVRQLEGTKEPDDSVDTRTVAGALLAAADAEVMGTMHG
jgi:hypothetical protein